MGTKNDPGEFDCYAKAGPDEQMFVLLGRDRYAGALVREWANARRHNPEDRRQVDEALGCALKMEDWCRAMGKVPAQLAQAKWFVNATVDGEYYATLCYTDEEMEDAFIEFAQGDVMGEDCEDRELLAQQDRWRAELRDVNNWGPARLTHLDDPRTNLNRRFEEGWVAVHRYT
jgi:hypothetical protein